MDADRYARVREIFLEAEELPQADQAAFVREQTSDDDGLRDEVMSLLGEHDAESARVEGERAMRLPNPGGTGTGPIPTAASPQASQRDDVKGTGQSQPESDRLARDQSSQATRTGAQRTYAAPRNPGADSLGPSPKTMMYRRQARKRRRINTGWLWLGAILPTILVGWLTYRRVDDMLRSTLKSEMSARVDSIAMSVDRYLEQKASLVRSWSRQDKLRSGIISLAELATTDDGDFSTLKSTPHAGEILRQLQGLSGHQDIEFSVWNRNHQVIASSSAESADLGRQVERGMSSDLALAFRGETVIVGPTVRAKAVNLSSKSNAQDTIATQPTGDAATDDASTTNDELEIDPESTDQDKRVADTVASTKPAVGLAEKPYMAMIVPVFDDAEQVVAVLLVRNIGIYNEFNRQFRTSSVATAQDTYAVSSNGRMMTESLAAAALASEGRLELQPNTIATRLRVADPGMLLTTANKNSFERSIRPLTFSTAGVTAKRNDVLVDPYPNYAGVQVVGGWRWLGDWQLGIIVERPAIEAFGPSSVVRYGFLTLAALLSFTAIGSAAIIARKAALSQASVHPLSRYEICDELGSGGMGIVYRARHKQLGREAALKVLRSDRQSRDDRLRFDREAKLAATLTNPHSVTIYDYGAINESEAFCVMEMLRGLTLYEAVARSGFQSIGRSLFILRQICDAIDEAHQHGLMHRDLKPQNVMLSLDPSVGDWAVVFDFGLAKPLEHDPDVFQTSETIWAGTPMYMAPERFRDPSVMDPRSDLYSIGCIAYFLLSGRPPFAECDPESMFALILSEHPIQIATHRGESFPNDVDQFVAKCMAKNSADRFACMLDVTDALDRMIAFYPWGPAEAKQWWKTHGEESV